MVIEVMEGLDGYRGDGRSLDGYRGIMVGVKVGRR